MPLAPVADLSAEAVAKDLSAGALAKAEQPAS
jgi:hypothetical protein